MSRMAHIFAAQDRTLGATNPQRPDAQQVGLAIANLPSFARRLNKLGAQVDARAAVLGEGDPAIQAARAQIAAAAAKLRQIDAGVRDAYESAVSAGQLPDVPPPTATFSDDAEALSGISTNTVISSIIALGFAVAAAIALFVAAPVVAAVLAIGGTISAIVAAVSGLGDTVGPLTTSLLVPLAIAAALFLFLGRSRR